MTAIPLRKYYKDFGKNISDSHELSDSQSETMHEDLFDLVFFALFWCVHLPLHRLESRWSG